jgi:hypothetical protein
MKNILILLTITASFAVQAQDFNKDLASARSAYGAGNLEDARFAMQQMLNDIDVIVGKEILKLLPAKMDAMASDAKKDNVTVNTGLTGVTIRRDYGTGAKTADLEIMGNSPLVASLNALLSIPMVGNSGDGTQKTVKVQGYKGILEKKADAETGKTNYTLQLPVNGTLITFNANDTNEADVLRLANTIPVTQIAKLVQ